MDTITSKTGDVLTFGTGSSEGTYTETASIANDVAAINNGKFGVTATQTRGTTFTLSSANSDLTVGEATTPADIVTAGTTSSQYYDIGISAGASVYAGGASTNIKDSSTTGGTANVGLVGNSNGSGGVATISYSD